MQYSVSSHQGIRQLVDEALAASRFDVAARLLRKLWRQSPTLPHAAYLTKKFVDIREHVGSQRKRLFILRSFTVEPVVPLLVAECWTWGIELQVQVGDFNAYVQEILNPQSTLYQFQPELVLLATHTRDLIPAIWHPAGDPSQRCLSEEVDRVTHQLESLIRTFRANSPAALVLPSLDLPAWPADGMYDAQVQGGQLASIRDVNNRLRDMAQRERECYVFDYDHLVSQHGRLTWSDERMWVSSRLPVSNENMIHLAKAWARQIIPVCNIQSKVLVCDLDNTLWAGIIGEDGIDGIKMADDYSGYAYRQLQRAILDLYARGVILAICSKNNFEDAHDVLANHPDMLMRPQHFASMQINWKDKVENLRTIAAEINVGLDALAFLDDNPAERARVSDALPEVAVLELGDDPAGFAPALRGFAPFERLMLSSEDRRRSAMYAEQRQRVELQHSVTSLEDYYRSLQMRIILQPLTAASIARVGATNAAH